MKRAVIVHCWGGNPEYCWYPYAKKELEENGFEVHVPSFPDTDAPSLEKWLPVLKGVVGSPDEDTYLIGHSVGCITILRYLESLGEGQKIGGAVLVAGFANNVGLAEIQNFFTTNVSFEKIKERAHHFVAIHSDNDPYVPLTEGEVLKEKLGAELIVKHNAQHFSGSIGEEGSCVEIPDVVKSVLQISE